MRSSLFRSIPTRKFKPHHEILLCKPPRFIFFISALSIFVFLFLIALFNVTYVPRLQFRELIVSFNNNLQTGIHSTSFLTERKLCMGENRQIAHGLYKSQSKIPRQSGLIIRVSVTADVASELEIGDKVDLWLPTSRFKEEQSGYGAILSIADIPAPAALSNAQIHFNEPQTASGKICSVTIFVNPSDIEIFEGNIGKYVFGDLVLQPRHIDKTVFGTEPYSSKPH